MNQMFILKRLFDEIDGSFFEGLNGILHGRIGSEHDDGLDGVNPFNHTQGLIAVHSGKVNVQQNDVRPLFLNTPDPFFSGGGDQNLIPFETEKFPDDFQGIRGIINNQHFSFGLFRSGLFFHLSSPRRRAG